MFEASPRNKKQEGPRPLEPAREHPLYYDWGRQTPASQVAAGVRSEVNNSLIIVNFFHKIQNFRQISDLFSQI